MKVEGKDQGDSENGAAGGREIKNRLIVHVQGRKTLAMPSLSRCPLLGPCSGMRVQLWCVFVCVQEIGQSGQKGGAWGCGGWQQGAHPPPPLAHTRIQRAARPSSILFPGTCGNGNRRGETGGGKGRD